MAGIALVLLAAVVGDGLMVVGLAQTVAVVAVVRLQRLCQRVGLGLEDDAPAMIV